MNRDPKTGRFRKTKGTGMAKVIDGDGRVHFSGNEEDARAYVERNFPHIVIPDSNDAEQEVAATVVVVDDSNTQHAYVGGQWDEVDYDTKNGRFVV